MKQRRLIIGLVIALVLIVFCIWDSSKAGNGNGIIKWEELTEIQGVIADDPEISRSKNGSSVSIELKEYPGFSFNVRGIRYRAFAAQSFVNDVQKGDTLYIKILNYDYETKIEKSRSLRITEKIFGYRGISPYSIYAKDKNYMSLTDVNKAMQHNRDFGEFMVYYLLILTSVISIIYLILRLNGLTRKFELWWKQAHKDM